MGLEEAGGTPGAAQQFGTRLVPGRVLVKGHLAAALGVSVGRLQGFSEPAWLVGRDSGGGIRTRDLRVMSGFRG